MSKIDPFDFNGNFDDAPTLSKDDLEFLRQKSEELEFSDVERISLILESFIPFWLEHSDKSFIEAATMFDNLDKGL